MRRQEQRFAFAHLDELPQDGVVLGEHALEDVVDLIAGMQVRRIVDAPGPKLRGANREFVRAHIKVIQVAEMRPLRRIDEMTDQLAFDVNGALAIGGKG